MKTLKIFSIFAVILFVSACFAQSPQVPTKSDDLPTVQKNFMNYVIYAGELEKANANLMATLNRVVADLSKIETVAQLDSVRTAYQIPKAEKGKSDEKPGNKTSSK
jgi:hypothetical protein